MVKILQLDQREFATCLIDKTIRIQNFENTDSEKILTGHSSAITNIIKLRNGRLCSASWDKTIKIWDMERGVCEKTLSVHSSMVKALVELPNGVLISGEQDQIRFWNLKSLYDDKACIRILSNKGWCSSIIVLSNDEMACVSGSNINVFKIYGCDRPLKKLAGHIHDINALLLHSDRQQLISCGGSWSTTTMRIWDIQSGSCIKTISGKSFCSGMVWFQGNVVASGYKNSEIKFWNIYTGECVKTLKHRGRLNGLVIDLEGNLISYGDEMIIWGSSTTQQILRNSPSSIVCSINIGYTGTYDGW